MAASPEAAAQASAWTSPDGVVSMLIPTDWVTVKDPKHTLFIERTDDQEKEWADCKVVVGSAPNLLGESQEQLNSRMEQRPKDSLTRGGGQLVEYSTSTRVGEAAVRKYTVKYPGMTLRGREIGVIHSQMTTGIMAICTYSDKAPKDWSTASIDFLKSLAINAD